MLEAAGFVAEAETREQFKKVDVRWRREDLDGPLKYAVEAKDHVGTLGMGECRDFLTDYSLPSQWDLPMSGTKTCRNIYDTLSCKCSRSIANWVSEKQS